MQSIGLIPHPGRRRHCARRVRCSRAQAQDPAANYPNKPIRLIVPFAAGGGNDIFARLVTAKASEYLGQQFVIENRAAAGGRPAAEFVANQPADGYTMFIAASGVMSVASAVYPKLAYHPTKSFRPLTMIADFPLIMVSPVQNPAKTVAELVAYAKANPDKSNYGTTSPAFTISTELLKLKTGMPGVGIPLKSSAEMILCVIQENCLISISDGPPAIPQIKAGKVRALAVTGAERSPELPDVPSMAEAGYPEVNTKLWSGFFVPAKTPPAHRRQARGGVPPRHRRSRRRRQAQGDGGDARRRHRRGIPQDDRRRHPELRLGGEGREPEVRIAARS